MGRQVSRHRRRLPEEDEETVREDYVQKMRDNYPLIIRTLMHDLIVSVDKEGNLVFLNDAAVEFWGTSSEEIIGTHFFDYLHPEDVNKTQVALQEIIKSKGQVKGLIVRVKSPRGARNVAWNAVAIFDKAGNYVGIQATGKDLTDLFRTEEELKWSQRHFQRLFEVLVDPVVIADMKGNILELSQSAEEILGFPRDELVGKHFMETDVVTDQSKAAMMKNLEKMKNGEYIPPYTIEAVTKDGKKLLYELTPAQLTYKGEPAILGIFHNITEQKRAEEKLLASEERFKYFVENAPEAIWVQDINGIFSDGNKLVEELAGYKKEELIGKNMLDLLVPPESVPRLLEAFKPEKVGEKSGPNEVEMIKKDGSLVPVEASTILVEREGKVEIIGVARDITERKRAEKELIRLSSAVRISNDSIVISGIDGTILDINESTLKMYGSDDKSVLIGTNAFELVVPEEREKALAGMKELLKEGYLPNREYTVVAKDGSRIPVEMSTAIMKDADGKPMGFVSISRDITERKKAEEALRESERRFRELSELLPEIVFETDVTGELTFVNKAAFDYIGYSQEDFDKGLNALQMLVPEERDSAKKTIGELLSGKKVSPNEYTALRKDGSTFPILIHSTPVTRENRVVGMRGIIVDITEQKLSEEKVRQSEERYRTVFENTGTAMCILEDDKTISMVNRRFEELSGYSWKELKGKKWTEFVTKEYLERMKRYHEARRKKNGKAPSHYSFDFVNRKGQIRNVLLTIELIPGTKKSVASILDITDQKRAENELKESEEKFRTIFEGATDGILAADPQTFKFVFINPRMLEIVGYPDDELINLTVADLTRKEDVPFAIDQFKQQLEGKITRTRNMPILRKDKTIVYCDISSRLMEIGEKQYLVGFFRDVTEQKKAEEALLRSEREARQLLEFQNKVIDTATVWVNLLDLKGNVILWNRAAELISGYSRKEIIGHKKMWKWLYPDSDYRVKLFAVGKEILGERKHLEDFESTVRCKDGSIKTISWYATVVLDEKGNPAGSIAIGIDITERKRAEKELIRLSSAVRMSNDGIAITDIDGTVLDVNEAALKMYGSNDKSDLIGINAFELVVPEEREKALAGIKEMLEKGHVQSQEYTVVAKDGSRIPVDMSLAIMKDADDKPIGFVTISRDITERKKAEEALRESEEKYRSIINGMNDTVWVIDSDFSFIDVNDAAVKALGYSRKELLSMKIFDIDFVLDPKKIKNLANDMPKDEVQVFETAHTTKNGKTIPVEISSSLVTYKGKQVILSIARDITERKKAQEAIKRANGLLKQSNRELESYTYVVSHDLKAPLRTIRSFGSFLLEDYGDKLDETGKDYLNRMINASSHLNSMIEDLLTLSRVGRKFTEIEKVDLNDLLKEILTDLEATIKERNAEVVVDKLPTLYVQRAWKRQLLMNLISNALKFNESKTPKIEVMYEERENDRLFKIRDNGIGIEEKYLTRIFNLFERAPTEKKYEGTGAGLAICKKIVEQLGGEIWVESTPGKGSTFMFTIPKEMKQEKEA
jgi:PAS domain S-box-containing protein